MTSLPHKEIGQAGNQKHRGLCRKLLAVLQLRKENVTVQKDNYSAAIPGSFIPLSCAPKGGKQLTGDWTMYGKKINT